MKLAIRTNRKSVHSQWRRWVLQDKKRAASRAYHNARSKMSKSGKGPEEAKRHGGKWHAAVAAAFKRLEDGLDLE